MLGSYGKGNDLLPLLNLPPSWGIVSPDERARRIKAGQWSRDETS
jgi:hypothetical protein